MAVEIKEIVIKAVLSQEGQANGSSGASKVDQQAMIQECVNQVLKVLEKKKRR